MNNFFYKIYHANLAFSAIEEESLGEVIDKTYFPLLELVENQNLKVGLELSAYTLEKIQELRPLWIEKFKHLHKLSLVELIGSGYMQIIAPIVPYEINIQNQTMGLEVYKTILGITPTIAYVNEQVFSTSLVDIYVEVGYKAIAMEWNNAYATNTQDWKKSYSFQPVLVNGLKTTMPILWTDTIIFQQFQRMAHSELEIDNYINLIKNYIDDGYKALPIYSSDLEVFNYRPGRFETEAIIDCDEWERILDATSKLKKIGDFLLPSEILKNCLDNSIALTLTNSQNPILVKKQTKYSLSRWAACGRGANQINTLCYNYFLDNDKQIKKVLHYWGSDFRTHTTIKKWDKAIAFLTKKQKNKKYEILNNDINIKEDKDRLIFEKDNYKIVFNKQKGLAIQSIFNGLNKLPFGTVGHGELDHISYGADFYTGTTILEASDIKKVTDLSNVEKYSFDKIGKNTYKLSTKINMKTIATQYKNWIIDLDTHTLTLDVKVELSKFILGSIRLGSFTLLPQSKTSKFWYECKNGGKEYERFYFSHREELLQSNAMSLIQSSNGGIGVTDGILRFGIDDKIIVQLKIDRKISYPFIMLQNSFDNEKYLTRVFFSLQELDDTLKHTEHKIFRLKYSIDI